jgi:hypothetical protein
MNEKLITIAVVTMAGTVAAHVLCRPRTACPDCRTLLPRISWKYVRSFWWGGWICPNCGCEIDRSGAKLLPRSERLNS